ncbi:Dynamin domain-containing protein [Desulfonema limicola]|uniref:Dynamin domain-containing protein n=1 Tax=Desulfonema limicola TaxID=45656 RepID=A0A975GEN5_9BACT|nr:dynamin family protein [Desulfonema limicola]QTA78373.1 Dynamin domain-containing protein [Desulfonema limicola]
MNNQNIESIEYRFNIIIKLMNQAGYTGVARVLEKELNSLKSETYKIAVAGEYKTGKSTLINRIFLKEDILFTDIMEATALAAEINYGTQKRLEIIYCDKEKQPVVIKQPCLEDIRLYTSAQTPEARAFIAENTARARLFWPANNLDGLTVFDTPGINSINSAVISATYCIIPESDLVLFVTGDKQLSSVELEFLSSRVFSQGITRVFAIVTYSHDADQGNESIKQREKLIQTIKSQLSNTGRENIPVAAVNIRDNPGLTESRKDNFRHQIDNDTAFFPHENNKNTVDDVICDLLGQTRPGSDSISSINSCQTSGSEPPESEPEPGSFAALEKKLISFIRENVRPGRLEKAEKVLNIQVQLAFVQCETELSVMGKNQVEREQMLADIKVREAEMGLKYEKLSREFKQELTNVEQGFIFSLQKGLGQIAELYTSGFDVCNDLGELQQKLESAQFYLKRKIEEMFVTCSHQAEDDIREIIRNYGIKSQAILHPWYYEVSRELNISGGILAKIPPFALLAIDIMLFVRFGPFGPLADILIRLLANYIPFLNKTLPVSLAARVLKQRIQNSLKTEFETIRQQLPDLVKNNFNALINNIMDEWNNHADQQISTIRKSIEKIVHQPGDEKRQAFLKDMKHRLEIMLL